MRLFLLLSISSIVSAANGPFQFGESRARAVDFNSSSKVQTAEYTDGFKFSVTTLTAITMNVVTQEAVNPGTLGANLEPLNDYAYIVKTSNADVKLAAELRIPFNRTLFALMRPQGACPTTMLVIAKRPLNATSGQFLPLNAAAQVVNELPEDRIVISGLTQLDGQYLILITPPKRTEWASDVQSKLSRRALGESEGVVIEPIQREVGFGGETSSEGDLDSGSVGGVQDTTRRRRDAAEGFGGGSSSGADMDSGSVGGVAEDTTNLTSKSTDSSMNVATSQGNAVSGDSAAALAIIISIAAAIVIL